MKRFLLLILALSATTLVRAETMPTLVKDARDAIGPATGNMTVFLTTGSWVAIAAPTEVGVRNCLTKLDVTPRKTSAVTSYTINILDGGTTTYTLTTSTGTSINLVWPETYPWCGRPKRATYITGTSLNQPTGVVLDVSYQGFTK